METNEKTYRQEAGPWQLIRTAIGTPEAVRGKLERAGRTFGTWGNRKEIARRLRRLQELGYMDEVPTAAQLAVGTWDVFRYFLIPGSADFYNRQEINFWFHQALRWLDDPVSMLDPLGVLSERDTIIGHVMQVTHHDPTYDLQLLEMYEDGIAELERQIEEVIAGTHPRTVTLRATNEEPDYLPQLLTIARAFRKDRTTHLLLRKGFFRIQTPEFLAAERTFSTLRGTLRYCGGLPKDPAKLLQHLLFENGMPLALATREPDRREYLEAGAA